MDAQLATWITQVNDATGFLKRLYVGLKDPVQRERAETAGAYARERQRSSRRMLKNPQLPWIGLSSDLAERTAWISAISGLLGLNLLVAMGDSSSSSSQASLLHRRLNRDLSAAIRGFSAAFPSELVAEDLDTLCEAVVEEASRVAEATWSEVRTAHEAPVNIGDFLQQEWLGDIKSQIRTMVKSPA